MKAKEEKSEMRTRVSWSSRLIGERRGKCVVRRCDANVRRREMVVGDGGDDEAECSAGR